MGQMKRQAMLMEDHFWEIAQENMYLGDETWEEYRDHMRNQKALVAHLKYSEVEEELKEGWDSYQAGFVDRRAGEGFGE